MKVDYRLDPELEYCTYLINAMERAGRLDDAESCNGNVIRARCSHVAVIVILFLHGEADMAQKMARRLLELDPYDDSAYVIAANVFSRVGRWDEVANVRKTMKKRRVKKEGGRSWIEVTGKVHVFLAGGRKHERVKEIYTKLEELMEEFEKLGYVPVRNEMLHNVGEGEKKEALWYHSEKPALAFGLLVGGSPPGKALIIVKNLRVCRDCHESLKYILVE